MIRNVRKKKIKIESLDLEKVQKELLSEMHSKFVFSLSGRKIKKCMEGSNDKSNNQESKQKSKHFDEEWIDEKVKLELHNLWSNHEILSKEFNCFRLKYKTFNGLKTFWKKAKNKNTSNEQTLNLKLDKKKEKLDLLSSMFVIKELSEEYENSFKNSGKGGRIDSKMHFRRIKNQVSKYTRRNFSDLKKRIKSIEYKQSIPIKTNLKLKIKKKLRRASKKKTFKKLKIETENELESLQDTLKKLKILLDSTKTRKELKRNFFFEKKSDRRYSNNKRSLRFNGVKSFSELYERSKSFSYNSKSWKTFVKLKNIR
jgi:Holliday junction resolvase RusA-like endonuclease